MKNKFQILQTPELRKQFLSAVSPAEAEELTKTWWLWAHLPQIPPTGNWRKWLFMGGRGAGKTRAGAEWIKSIACDDGYTIGDSAGHIALIGETYQDASAVMVEGQSGLLSVHRKDTRPKWNATRRLLEWPNGVIGKVYSANDPESLRGSQFGAAWCDEIAKWRYLEDTYNMLQFCMRLGQRPRQMMTTTPKNLSLLKKLLKQKDTVVTRSSSATNEQNLAPGFLAYLNEHYGGTHLGRQEIDGEIIEDLEGALWKRSLLDGNRIKKHPPLRRIVVAVDPPASATEKSDACGIIAAGKDENGICYILADATVQGLSPEAWSKEVVDLYHLLEADCILAEVNQGGDMVKSILRISDPDLPIKTVHAGRAKWTRAEPIAMLYSTGRVRHVGGFPELEDQMCNFTVDGLLTGRSPDRLDALVWALSELALASEPNPRIRTG